ncbi:hypothetical protein LT493_23240 [Streptomyces tricolor]|nr:hypothetical protein [Streptomyces tricolor]
MAQAGRPAAPSDAGAAPKPYERSPHGAPPDRPREARKRRRGQCWFAGVVEEDGAAPVVARGAAPRVPDSPGGPRAARRVAPDAAGVEEVVSRCRRWWSPRTTRGEEAVAEAVGRLARCEAEGRSGEAHVLLARPRGGPPAGCRLLADALHRVGLRRRLGHAAVGGRRAYPPANANSRRRHAHRGGRRTTAPAAALLRQGRITGPRSRSSAAVLRLDGEGREREARALLDAYVRVRTPRRPPGASPPIPGGWSRCCSGPRSASPTSGTGISYTPCASPGTTA